MAGKELPYTPGNNAAIVARIENAKGPVGPGHHNSHRTNHLMEWLKKKESGQASQPAPADKGGKQPPKKLSKAEAYRLALKKKAGGN